MTIRRDLISWAAIARDAIGFVIATSTGVIVWLRKRGSRYWPLTFGNVESISTLQDNVVWRTDVAYSYSIENEFYPGQFRLRSWSERKAAEKELRWKGRKIGVRYSPRNPRVSVVRIEDQAGLNGDQYLGRGFPS